MVDVVAPWHLQLMATSRRTAGFSDSDGAAKNAEASKDGVLAAGETSARLARWLDEHGRLEASSQKKPVTSRVGSQPPILAALRHAANLEHEDPRHERSACQACVVASIIFKVESHAHEIPAWTAALHFAREIERAAGALDTLDRRVKQRLAELNCETVAASTASSDLRRLRDDDRRNRSVDDCKSFARFLGYARDEMRRLAVKQLAAFQSSDHRVIAKSNPPRPLIKEITRDLADVGFTANEIVTLIADGHGSTNSPRSRKDAVDRVRKRLAPPASGTPNPSKRRTRE